MRRFCENVPRDTQRPSQTSMPLSPCNAQQRFGCTTFHLLLDCRAQPTKTKVESGTSQSKSGTSVKLSNPVKDDRSDFTRSRLVNFHRVVEKRTWSTRTTPMRAAPHPTLPPRSAAPLPATTSTQSRLLQVLDLYWRSPESGGL